MTSLVYRRAAIRFVSLSNSLIPGQSHTFVEIPFPLFIQEGLFVSYKQKYVHEVTGKLLVPTCPGKSVVR